jgi:hypothetical protein
MRRPPILLTALLALAVPAVAHAQPSAGTYKGTTSEGRNITVKVAGGAVTSATTHVVCDGYPTPVVAQDGADIRKARFSLSEDHILSGTGGEDETVGFAGRFDGRRLTGSVSYSYSSDPPDAPGQSSSCSATARFTARLVRRR